MKRQDKLAELRDLELEAITTKAKEAERELMNLRFRNASGQLEQTSRLKQLRRDVARMKTIVSQKQQEQALAANS